MMRSQKYTLHQTTNKRDVHTYINMFGYFSRECRTSAQCLVWFRSALNNNNTQRHVVATNNDIPKWCNRWTKLLLAVQSITIINDGCGSGTTHIIRHGMQWIRGNSPDYIISINYALVDCLMFLCGAQEKPINRHVTEPTRDMGGFLCAWELRMVSLLGRNQLRPDPGDKVMVRFLFISIQYEKCVLPLSVSNHSFISERCY